MSKDEALNMMRNSRTVAEWNRNVDTIKAAMGGLPAWWYEVKTLNVCLKRIVPGGA